MRQYTSHGLSHESIQAVPGFKMHHFTILKQILFSCSWITISIIKFSFSAPDTNIIHDWSYIVTLHWPHIHNLMLTTISSRQELSSYPNVSISIVLTILFNCGPHSRWCHIWIWTYTHEYPGSCRISTDPSSFCLSIIFKWHFPQCFRK